MIRSCLTITAFLLAPLLQAQTTTVDFESLADGTVLTNQISGLVFANAGVLKSGTSLNELEFPPHSGQNVAFDSGGPMTITFSPPLTSFSANFNYRTTVTLTALDASGKTIATATSRFSSNLKVSGSSGSSPNEVLQVAGAAIASVTISGDAAGASFSMDDAQIIRAGTYLVGDVFPSTSDSIGNFGDGALNILDLLALLRAIVLIPGATPAACSDLFDAMDVYPTDTTGQRGGDGILNTLDLLEELRRVANTDASRPTRASRSLTCAAVSAQSIATSQVYAGTVIIGPSQNGRRAIYLVADRDLSLVGLSIGLGVGQTQVRFTPAPDLPPSVSDTALPGVLAAAWLNGLTLPAGQRVLLGYVGEGTVKLYGALGNGTDGSDVSFRLQGAQQ